MMDKNAVKGLHTTVLQRISLAQSTDTLCIRPENFDGIVGLF